MNVKYFLGRIKKTIFFALCNLLYGIKFLVNRPKEGSVLLVEANNCHTELFPSYVKYLKSSGYNTEVIALCTQKKILPKLDAKKYFFSISAVKKILSFNKIKRYDFVIYTSYRLYYKQNNKPYFYASEKFDTRKPAKYGNIYTLHHLEDYTEEIKTSKGAIVLSEMLKKEDNLFAVNPCYFRESTAIKEKNKKAVFITVGKLEDIRRSSNLLYNGIRGLLKDGINNFEVLVAGSNKENAVPGDLKNYIKVLGRLSFENMYKALFRADFYLPLFDPGNEAHKRYITTGTSGSYQLIRGFLLPPVIQENFAHPHGLNQNCAIIYSENKDFTKALKKAVNLNKENYKALQDALLKQKNEIMESSINNFKLMLEAYKGCKNSSHNQK